MNLLCRIGIHLPEHLVQPLFPRRFSSNRLKLPPQAHIPIILCKINIIDDALDIKPCSPGQNRDMPPGPDSVHRHFRQPLEKRGIERLIRIQNIDQMVRNTPHFVRTDFRGADIHPPVDLHGICRYDLPADLLCQTDGKLCLA